MELASSFSILGKVLASPVCHGSTVAIWSLISVL
jgi:hypothetical protein